MRLYQSCSLFEAVVIAGDAFPTTSVPETKPFTIADVVDVILPILTRPVVSIDIPVVNEVGEPAATPDAY